MKYQSGFGRRGGFCLKPAHWALVVSSVAAAGCSADVTRFDSASFSLNDPPPTTASVEQKSGTDFANPVTRSQRPGPYGAGLGSRAGGIESEPLPDASPAAAPLPPAAPATAAAPRSGQPSYRPAGTQVAMAATPAPITDAGTGETIEVQPGDTLYRLSRKHQVSLDELMRVNGLTSPNLKPGQKLVLPPASATAPRMAAVTPAALPQAAPAAAAVAAPSALSPQAEAKYDGTYTVQPGDSIYAIARKHKVAFTELQQVNGIVDPLKVRPGVVLKVPAMAGSAIAAAPQPLRTAAVNETPAAQPAVQPVVQAAPAAPAASPSGGSLQPTVINAAKPADTTVPVPPSSEASNTAKGDKVAIATPPPAKAAAGDTSKLRWPAQGKIIAGFGGRPDGTHNDGINLSVPLGTDVHAAESGVVAYAGSELKGYGNLVLVRHDNGWVTAYAHNEELLVKRGDKVARGQVIAKAGKTGTVDQPQVHFELRQGSKPVDPTPFMERL